MMLCPFLDSSSPTGSALHLLFCPAPTTQALGQTDHTSELVVVPVVTHELLRQVGGQAGRHHGMQHTSNDYEGFMQAS